MAKKEYREAQRVKPLGVEGLARIRQIVAEHSYAKVNEVCVDAFSAQYIVALHDQLSAENQAKLLGLPVAKTLDMALRLLA
jgi:hypothetical protein